MFGPPQNKNKIKVLFFHYSDTVCHPVITVSALMSVTLTKRGRSSTGHCEVLTEDEEKRLVVRTWAELNIDR